MKILVESADAPQYISFNSESLNAMQLAGGKFELRNSSLLIEDLVFGDTIDAKQSASGTLTYANLVTRAGKTGSGLSLQENGVRSFVTTKI